MVITKRKVITFVVPAHTADIDISLFSTSETGWYASIGLLCRWMS